MDKRLDNGKSMDQISESQGNYYSLVIGNAEYTNPFKVWQPLETAVTDAKEIAETLKTLYVF